MTHRNDSRTRAEARAAAVAATSAATRSVIESLESRALMSTTAAVESFTLIDAAADREIMTLAPGATINLATLASRELNVRANVSGETTAVEFRLDGVRKLEKSAVFAMAGDRDGNYKSWTPTVGSHTLRATAIGGVETGDGVAVTFRVIDQEPAPEPENPNPTPAPTAPSVTRFVLVDATTNRDLMTLGNGATIDVSKLPAKLGVRAVVGGNVTSVRFSLNGVANYRTENLAPYALDADTSGRVNAWTLSAGAHTLSAVALNGTTASAAHRVSFNLVGAISDPTPNPTPNPTPTPKPNPTPTPTPTPNPTGKPGAHNTGPTNTSILRKVSGGFTVTQDGAVIENVDVDGDIQVKASNVTIRNFRATGIKFYDEPKYGSHRNLLVENGEISDPSGGTGIVGGHMTVRRVEIHHMGADGINVHANAVIENCYIHHLGMADGSHADAISGSSPDGRPVLGVVIRNNNLDIPSSVSRGVQGARPENNGYRSNGVIFVGLFGTKDNPMIVEGNWLNGGNYTVSSGLPGAEIHYANNKFGRGFNWGVQKRHGGVPSNYFSGDRWVGNTWADTGKPM